MRFDESWWILTISNANRWVNMGHERSSWVNHRNVIIIRQNCPKGGLIKVKLILDNFPHDEFEQNVTKLLLNVIKVT